MQYSSVVGCLFSGLRAEKHLRRRTGMTQETERFELWFKRPKPNPKATLRLFCFPFAGGGTVAFHGWLNNLPPEVELCVLQLPGREHRFREKAFDQLLALVNVLANIIPVQLHIPFAFFGHSLGALIAFELARHLKQKNLPAPVHLFVSGWRAPHMRNPHPLLYEMPKSMLLNELKHYEGTPESVLRESELMEIFLPILRADFKMGETYAYQNGNAIDCAITAFGGTDDNLASRQELEAWHKHTSSNFRLKMFQGGHFFIKNDRQKLMTEIVTDLQDYL
jgi:medium-chain acyl-[acyl-carrier-protein] hydrolase